MKILLVGKTGVFDTLAVAAGYLNKRDIIDSEYFGDLALENSKKPVMIGFDQNGNEIYILGYNVPEIIYIIDQELKTIANIDNNVLRVIPIKLKNENTTWILCKIANIPLLGSFFLNWTKNKTRQRMAYLFAFGEKLRAEDKHIPKNKSKLVLAAKPLSNKK